MFIAEASVPTKTLFFGHQFQAFVPNQFRNRESPQLFAYRIVYSFKTSGLDIVFEVVMYSKRILVREKIHIPHKTISFKLDDAP